MNHLEVGMEAESRLKLILSVKKRDEMQWECIIREAVLQCNKKIIYFMEEGKYLPAGKNSINGSNGCFS